MTAEVHGFQTEVAKLLNLLANSLYSNKEVFLRELISNASDAIDKLHFLSLTNPDLVKDDPTFKIRIKADKENKTITISDNGLGMTLAEANEHLGTIAKSGTEDFLKHMTGDAQKDSQLIGQFGVGFYSAFIVADKVTVLSRSATVSADEGVSWESTGEGTFTSENIHRDRRGTDIILHIKDSESEFLDSWRLRSAITKYSDHISVPVELWEEKYEAPAEGEDANTPKEPKFEYVQVNDAKALWTRAPKEIKDEEYKEFYKHLSSDYQDPLTWAHNKVEGELEYTSLLYIPRQAPWDLYTRDNKHGLKLFVHRVFIMDEAEQFLPAYLRFVKGLVDTNALPLNVSRELLQESAVTRKLKKALTKRVLNMLDKLSKTDDYKIFWQQFGNVLKEGPVEDYSNQEAVLKLLRFASTTDESAEQHVSLEDYVSRMKEKQQHIYYLTADSYQAAVSSPYLEQLKSKGIEVLLMWERVDEWLMGNVREFDGKTFISVTASDLQLGDLQDSEEQKKQEESVEQNKDLIERFKQVLGDKVQDVKVSTRLIDSPSCVVGEGGRMMTAQMRRIMEAAGQKLPDEKYILEINPKHALVEKAAAETDNERFAKWAEVIFAQALLTDQGTLKDPSAFVKVLNSLLVG
ncbi:MAG: molecular chaperone HtpG [Proteobacteria bacterium]|uniref:Chaperone protein HtpG n=1 Tax=Candidatus Avisuccinivibrio stercorigallinarum TaxID=2840704 RepID=A0A9D9D9N7_9GAMM|nr:molecular chaperone HtpG [Candidatus Avisuccinivibrio stercorigallinarum]